jgi:hypothetical protein
MKMSLATFQKAFDLIGNFKKKSTLLKCFAHLKFGFFLKKKTFQSSSNIFQKNSIRIRNRCFFFFFWYTKKGENEF